MRDASGTTRAAPTGPRTERGGRRLGAHGTGDGGVRPPGRDAARGPRTGSCPGCPGCLTGCGLRTAGSGLRGSAAHPGGPGRGADEVLREQVPVGERRCAGDAVFEIVRGRFGDGDRFELPWLIGTVAGVVALTALIVVSVAWRPCGRAARVTGAGIARGARLLGPRLPLALALTLRRRWRGALAKRLAAGTRTPVVMRQALCELTPSDAAKAERPVRVHSVLAAPTKLLASVNRRAHGARAVGTTPEPNRWERTGPPLAVQDDPSADLALALPHPLQRQAQAVNGAGREPVIRRRGRRRSRGRRTGPIP